MPADDEAHRRYSFINLPHARTVLGRIGRTLEALDAFGETGNGGAPLLRAAFAEAEAGLAPFDEDPPLQEAVRAADRVALLARVLVDAIVASPARSDRLGQHVRNLFECLGLAEEGAELSLLCGERPDSPMR
jgi:hypothetical protein